MGAGEQVSPHTQPDARYRLPQSPDGRGVVHPDAPGSRACIRGRPRLRVSRQTLCWREAQGTSSAMWTLRGGCRLLGRPRDTHRPPHTQKMGCRHPDEEGAVSLSQGPPGHPQAGTQRMGSGYPSPRRPVASRVPAPRGSAQAGCTRAVPARLMVTCQQLPAPPSRRLP